MSAVQLGAEYRLSKKALFAMLGYKPHAGQVQVHKSAAPRRVLACGVRWGKTLAAAMEGLAAALQPADRSIGWVVAPTYDLADRVFREIQLHAVTHVRHRIVTMRDSDRRLVILNLGGGQSEIRAKSADNPVSLLGEGLDWLIVDEASRLKPTIWQSHLSQRLLDKKGWALLISTPKGKGYFFDLFHRAKQDPEFEAWNMPSWTNPMLDRSLIDAERERVPERVFRQEYGAEFIEGAGSVFSNVRECATGSWKDPEPSKRYWAGLDLARVEDATVLVVMNEAREDVFADRFQRLDWGTQIARIEGNVRRYNRAKVHVDVTGVGDPIFEALRKEGLDVAPYPFTSKSKAALVNALVLMLEQRTIVLPRADLWPVGVEELEAYEYSVSEQGTVKMSAPGGSHDDCVMALALSAFDLRPTKEKHILWQGTL
jgi:hypothetical protein